MDYWACCMQPAQGIDAQILFHIPAAGNKGGKQLFRYAYSSAYQSTQRAFERCQASYDPNSIIALLQHNPYHLDSLLAMYDMYRHMGENQYAEEMLSRSIYCLEMAWHPAFNVASGNCRLDYEVEENRAMFIALFRHLQARGLHLGLGLVRFRHLQARGLHLGLGLG